MSIWSGGSPRLSMLCKTRMIDQLVRCEIVSDHASEPKFKQPSSDFWNNLYCGGEVIQKLCDRQTKLFFPLLRCGIFLERTLRNTPPDQIFGFCFYNIKDQCALLVLVHIDVAR